MPVEFQQRQCVHNIDLLTFAQKMIGITQYTGVDAGKILQQIDKSGLEIQNIAVVVVFKLVTFTT